MADAPLGGLNTFGIRARARVLWRIAALDELPAVLRAVREDAGGEPLVLGGGSNLLITGDVDRPVLQVALPGRRILEGDDDSVLIEAGAGESWDGLVRWSLAQGLSGLENLALIPGTAGAAPIQNIGAYGVEQRDVFDSLDAVDLHAGAARRFDAAECAFGYRDSLFKHAGGSRWLITAVRYRLPRRPRLHLDYGEIREELGRAGRSEPTAVDVADAVTAIRRRKLPDPAVLGNAGSFFKNPLLDPAQAQALIAREPGLPAWPAGDRVKLSAAWMIDRCGWKGHRDGDAGVHAAHALVLVNHGGASGAEVLTLARRIRDSVQSRFGVALEPEPVLVGPGRL
ncbi:MAG: UDP-N-acetylmuramate dehydrogenase [Burkholderiales bacterium]|nr:MAG: UDP-N-acetylmuramate dehydrogenase [Burkholderiales bacterium]